MQKKQKEKGNSFCWKPKTKDDIASTLTAHLGFGATDNSIAVKQIGNIVHTGNFKNPQRGRIYSDDGLSPCLNTCSGGNLEPKIIIKEGTDKTICLNSKGGRGGVEGLQSSLQDRIYSSEGISTAITTCFNPNVLVNEIDNPLKGISGKSWHFEQQVYSQESKCCRTIRSCEGSGNIPKIINDIRIRKLTPLECWRLMGFDDEDFYNAAKVNSNTQLYKQAGNSIVVDVLYYIFREFFV